MAAMTSIVGVQLGLASGSSKILSRGAGVSAKGPASSQATVWVPRRLPTHFCSEFHGSDVHKSSSSAVFSLERLVVKRQTFASRKRRLGGDQSLVVRGLFGLGVPEVVVIAGVAAILFGPKQLPEIGKSLGKTVKGFQQAAREFETAVKAAAEEPTPKESANTETSETPTSAPPPPPSPTTVSTPSDKERV